MIENKNNYDMYGRLDLSLNKHSISKEMQQCPICKEVHEFITLVHFQRYHNLSLEEAKEMKQQVTTTKPYEKKGKEFINERNKLTNRRSVV